MDGLKTLCFISTLVVIKYTADLEPYYLISLGKDNKVFVS